MRFISIVTTKENLVSNLETFAIFEDQLSNDVVAEAEKFFKKEARKYDDNLDDDDLELSLEEGYIEINDVCICFVWS
jgi:hypothetical protein